jgi:hypothetical protein
VSDSLLSSSTCVTLFIDRDWKDILSDEGKPLQLELAIYLRTALKEIFKKNNTNLITIDFRPGIPLSGEAKITGVVESPYIDQQSSQATEIIAALNQLWWAKVVADAKLSALVRRTGATVQQTVTGPNRVSFAIV